MTKGKQQDTVNFFFNYILITWGIEQYYEFVIQNTVNKQEIRILKRYSEFKKLDENVIIVWCLGF